MSAFAKLVVIAVGNPSRGDDALGPLLLERIATHLPDVTAICDFQLQIEHALDLRDADLVLFVDACTGLSQPVAFHEIGAYARVPVLSHALSPEAVLDVFRRVEGRAPPPTFVLALGGECFELGAGLSATARTALELGWALIRPMVERPGVEAWRRRAAEIVDHRRCDRPTIETFGA